MSTLLDSYTTDMAIFHSIQLISNGFKNEKAHLCNISDLIILVLNVRFHNHSEVFVGPF